MVAKKKATTRSKKLMLKRETLKDLDARGRARAVKGGAKRVCVDTGSNCPTK